MSMVDVVFLGLNYFFVFIYYNNFIFIEADSVMIYTMTK